MEYTPLCFNAVFSFTHSPPLTVSETEHRRPSLPPDEKRRQTAAEVLLSPVSQSVYKNNTNVLLSRLSLSAADVSPPLQMNSHSSILKIKIKSALRKFKSKQTLSWSWKMSLSYIHYMLQLQMTCFISLNYLLFFSFVLEQWFPTCWSGSLNGAQDRERHEKINKVKENHICFFPFRWYDLIYKINCTAKCWTVVIYVRLVLRVCLFQMLTKLGNHRSTAVVSKLEVRTTWGVTGHRRGVTRYFFPPHEVGRRPAPKPDESEAG